jgi:uncharacterized protein (DUF362 family)/Pyruvate/2-oxoacid:ferredoxin oxidoreductase delta subunit
MAKVVIKRTTYEYGTLRAAFFETMDSIGGRRIEKGARVLIKPNLLAPAPPESAVLTHPSVVRAAVEYVLERGGLPQVSDSPAMGAFEKILKVSGIKDALEGLDVEFKEFKNSVTIDAGEPTGKLELAEDAVGIDTIINLPKLKTHGQMLLTLGVKNLFGCVVGFKKPEWHLRAGDDRMAFARVIVQVYKSVKPSFTILDGVLAMEGRGPGKGGVPREVGVLMGSGDAVALDGVVCRMLGVDPERLPILAAAREMGLARDPVEIEGELPEVRNFKIPESVPLMFGPRLFHGFLRKHLIQRPVADEALCRLCGDCLRYCPTRAIGMEPGAVAFDYGKCIRCYCCLEVCPHGAVRTEEPALGALVKRLQPRIADFARRIRNFPKQQP